MTVHHYGLHAIIFHDNYSFNETFVKTHTSEYIKFVRVAAPTFDNNEPIISPNDFRYVVFNKWLKENSHNESGKILVNGVDYNWFMIADNDIFFQRNPFPLLDDYSNRLNLTFFGSFDGGQWKDEEVRYVYKQNLIILLLDIGQSTTASNLGRNEYICETKLYLWNQVCLISC